MSGPHEGPGNPDLLQVVVYVSPAESSAWMGSFPVLEREKVSLSFDTHSQAIDVLANDAVRAVHDLIALREGSNSKEQDHVSAPNSIQPEWATLLPIQQQSVMLLATRGPDGVKKHHGSKHLIRAYRATVIKAAVTGEMVDPEAGVVYDSFMDARALADTAYAQFMWEEAVARYFRVLDELPLHYHLHFVHAVQILGYKHPDPYIRGLWANLYWRFVHDLHLTPETEAEMDQRLNDFKD